MDQNSNKVTIPDRRVKPRIACNYPAVVQGRDPKGAKYEEPGKLANLSAAGLFLWINRNVEPGEKLFVTVQLTNPVQKEDALRLSTSGIVVRAEPQIDGAFGVAIKFQNYRFL